MRIGDVTCPFCGALCDDITVVVEDNKIKSIENACTLSVKKFMSIGRAEKPFIRNKELKYVSMDEAIEEAANILSNSKKPLLYGFSSTNCEAQSIGIEVAEKLGGVVDNTASVCHGPSIIAIQEVGLPSVTLGEVKNRADLVIYWGSNPMHAHPRHLSRYTQFPRGRFRMGRQARKLIVIDVRETETAKIADWFIKVEPNKDFEVLNALRTILNAGDIAQEVVGGVEKQELKNLIEKMKSCQFGIIFFGLGLTMSHGKHRNIVEAISLVIDLNKFTKFSIMPMRGHYNVTGSNEVLSWQTGFPYAVDFSKGYPWYNPGETDANSLLQMQDVDAALIIASDPAAHFPKSSVKYLAKIPTIVIDPLENLTSQIARVFIPSAVAGVETAGSAYRMDGVPLRLTKVIDPPASILTDEEILRKILEKLD
jgi:formylmethanofuran dehydrogenase subunit B